MSTRARINPSIILRAFQIKKRRVESRVLSLVTLMNLRVYQIKKRRVSTTNGAHTVFSNGSEANVANDCIVEKKVKKKALKKHAKM